MPQEKITFFINSLRGGGAERICVVLGNAFVNRGQSVEIVVLHLNNAVLHKELDNRIKLVNLNIKHARFSIIKIFKYILKNKPENILAFNHQLAVLLSFIRIFSRHRFRIISRNISTLSQKNRNERSLWHKYIVEFFTKTFYKTIDFIIAQSEGMLLDLIENYKVPHAKMKVIFNPVNPKIENHIRCGSWDRVSRKQYLLCVGRLEKVKSFACAIKVFAKIAPDYKNLRLKFVGDGNQKMFLMQLAAECGYADRIDFEGFQIDTIAYFLQARATVLTSLYEGFPNVLVESIFLGTPVVAFNCPSGPSEIVIDNVNGYLVRNRDHTHLEESFRKVINREWDRNEISATVSKFSSDETIAEYLKILKTNKHRQS